eukprot:CAMPEP_0201118970 /NCGR_PEP_ID=MMETSP0850-20130426/3156_1 /ASSEMBLY_ACC=CAM_ASM_000622 /TAXON_ID=183588 /ORGANISM="Pseudo-nitzschia fraudulenta, Strain WWA7" /LENGTH=413 /DNA_ID=CAMNT_0047384487 /DNA_START=139 /DNA_END=1380 /DNA_ORIENTATION=+
MTPVSVLRQSLLLSSLIALLANCSFCNGFSTRATPSSSPSVAPAAAASSNDGTPTTTTTNNNNNILILDHINTNHEKGRHDWLKAFYGKSFLGCAWDPRKIENLEKGRKTLWANIGAHQFHLPEGSPDAQVLDGVITVVHPSLEKLLEKEASIRAASRDDDDNDASCLNESSFGVAAEEGGGAALVVTDPWGTVFRVVEEGEHGNSDERGSQPGDDSVGTAVSDVTIHVPLGANLAGIGRFYQEILGAELAGGDDDSSVRIKMGPYQTLTFVPKESVGVDTHVDLRESAPKEGGEGAGAALSAEQSAGTSTELGNYGVHLSLYVADLPSCYQRARALGLAYVNTRFSRRAYTLEEAVADCMFRCLDIVDPASPEEGVILRLEHEVRSVVKKDGSKYKSCPFDEIPESCVGPQP